MQREDSAAVDPYRSGAEHLRDEIARIDQLVRAAAIRWTTAIGLTKERRLWGMPYVGGQEVDAYLETPFPGEPAGDEAFGAAAARHDEEARRCRQRIDVRLAATPAAIDLPLRQLAACYRLRPVETDALLLCALPEIDPRYRRLYGFLHDDVTRIRPSVEFLSRVVESPPPSPERMRRLLGPGAPLFARRLVGLVPAEAPLPHAARSVQIEDRVLGHLLGDPTIDVRIAPYASAAPPFDAWRPELVARTTDAAVARLRACWRERRLAGTGLVVALHGSPGSGRRAVACAVCLEGPTPLVCVDLGRLVDEASDWRLAIELCLREAALRHAAIYWSDRARPAAGELLAVAWATVLECARDGTGLSFLAPGSPSVLRSMGGGDAPLRVVLEPPDVEVRTRLWRAGLASCVELGIAGDRVAASLATAFQLNGGQIASALQTARSLASMRGGRVTIDQLFEGCRREAGERLGGLARRIEPTGTLGFDDLILPPPSKRQVLELRDRVLHYHAALDLHGLRDRMTYGRGIVALFAGPSGTGKTMAAELLAQDRRVDLYKVDLASIVSKYVGETEKNLKRVFDEAESSNAVLFIDEGESLFGQRGRIQQGQDRWANLEVSFLLQRIEEYSGVVVIATNLKQNIDDAFARRIHVIVDFPLPDAACRLALWKRLLPPAARAVDEDALRVLATRFVLAGGSIRNVVLDAAYRSLARSAETIGLRDLVGGIAREYQKSGRPLVIADFGREFFDWVRADVLEPPSADPERPSASSRLAS